MTDNKPYFDNEKRGKALAWIKQKIPNFECECCKQKHWVISEDITTPVIFAGGFNLGGQAYPHVLVTCINCGNTKLFNAVVMGILPPKKIDDQINNDGIKNAV